MADDERDLRRLALFDQLIALVPAGRCVDLGAGHGKFSERAAAAGWTVVGADPWVSPDRRFYLALPDRWVPETAGLRGQFRLALRTTRRRLRDRLP